MPINRFLIKMVSPVISGLFLFGLACLSYGSATAADTSEIKNARAQLEADRAACRDNAQYRDVNACLREAGAVYETRTRKKNQSTSFNSNFQENALKRCNRFTGDDRTRCEQRILNGPVEGSVKGGGVLFREISPENPPQNP